MMMMTMPHLSTVLYWSFTLHILNVGLILFSLHKSILFPKPCHLLGRKEFQASAWFQLKLWIILNTNIDQPVTPESLGVIIESYKIK